jgi:hypothetical protein
MDVFQAVVEGELAPIQLPFDGAQPFHQLNRLFIGDDADLGQHPAVGDAAGDVVGVQPPVIGDRGGKGLHALVRFSENRPSHGFSAMIRA